MTPFHNLFFPADFYGKFIPTQYPAKAAQTNTPDPDCAIAKLQDDKLDRKYFAKTIARGLCNWGTNKESFVVALTGKWGDGKTSAINMIKDALKTEGNLIFEFNPATFAEANKIQESFFDELAKFLSIKTKNEYHNISEKINLYKHLISNSKETSNILNNLFKVFLTSGTLCTLAPQFTSQLVTKYNMSSLTDISNLGIALLIFSFLIVLFNTRSEYIKYKAKKQTTSKTKKEIQTILKDKQHKLIIIIDDIDRLTKTEIRNLLLMVKINADFCNTNYLLAFDKDIVEMHLSEDNEISSQSFLDKIIQHTVPLPQISRSTLIKYAKSSIYNIAKQWIPSNDPLAFNHKYFEEFEKMGFYDAFENIREVKRFCNLIKFIIPLHINNGVMECNTAEVICIEWIRFFEPYIYQDIYHEGDAHIDLITNANYCNPKRSDQSKNILYTLFSESSEYHKITSISHPQSFYKYFTISTQDSVSEHIKSKLLKINSFDMLANECNQISLDYGAHNTLIAIHSLEESINSKSQFNLFFKVLIHVINNAADLDHIAIRHPAIKYIKNKFFDDENINTSISDSLIIDLPYLAIKQLKTDERSYGEHTEKIFVKFFNNEIKCLNGFQKDLFTLSCQWKIKKAKEYAMHITEDYKKTALFIKNLAHNGVISKSIITYYFDFESIYDFCRKFEHDPTIPSDYKHFYLSLYNLALSKPDTIKLPKFPTV